MIVRALDPIGDWTFGKGKNDYKSGVAAINQNTKTRLKSFVGDCFFASDAGIDWFSLLGTANKIGIELAVRATILNTVGVASIVKSETDFNAVTRRLTITYVINTVFTSSVTNDLIQGKANFILTQDGDVLTTEDGDPISGG